MCSRACYHWQTAGAATAVFATAAHATAAKMPPPKKEEKKRRKARKKEVEPEPQPDFNDEEVRN